MKRTKSGRNGAEGDSPLDLTTKSVDDLQPASSIPSTSSSSSSVEESLLRVPLALGWRRVTTVTALTAAGLQGTVAYHR